MADLKPYVMQTVTAVFNRRAELAARKKRGSFKLGPSQFNECHRRMWYSFRWVAVPKFEGRMLKLFDRGNREEENMVNDLRDLGLTVKDTDPTTGYQYLFRHPTIGHAGGYSDGLVIGLQALPSKWHILELKTHNAKKFKELQKKGVMKGFPEHFSQANQYMHWSIGTANETDRAFYFAVNKNDDDLYEERLRYNRQIAVEWDIALRNIIFSNTPPPRLSENPSFYKCEWCTFYEECHQRKIPKLINCRNCVHSVPEDLPDSEQWICTKHNIYIDKKLQEAGCHSHLFIPALVPFEPIKGSKSGNWVEYAKEDGRTFKNGQGSRMYPSIELSLVDTRHLGDEKLEQMREEFNARIVRDKSAKEPKFPPIQKERA